MLYYNNIIKFTSIMSNGFVTYYTNIAKEAYHKCKPIMPELTDIYTNPILTYQGDIFQWLIFLTTILEKICKENKSFQECVVSDKKMMTRTRSNVIMAQHYYTMSFLYGYTRDQCTCTKSQLNEFYQTYITNFKNLMFPSESDEEPIMLELYPVVFGILNMSELLINRFANADNNAMSARDILKTCKNICKVLEDF